MLWSILGALVLGAALAAAAYWALHRYIKTSTASAAPIDLTKLSLTVVAGVGGVVALVVAYRRQRDLEQGRFVERFGAAAAQLGSTDVAVRIAGVYAMAGVADESRGLRRQQCIDVLCGYLRLPYDAAHGSSGRTKRVVTTPNPRVEDLDDPGKVEEHHEYRNNDREVRATIVRIIAAHLRPEAEYSWSPNDFDFRTAYLEDADFQRATFSGDARFDGATFSGPTWFVGATFSGPALFVGATFSGDAWFGGATFSGPAWFEGATFSGDARFGGATFSGTAWFEGATFSGPALFGGATFSGTAWFEGATFSGPTLFGGATFSGTAGFDGATFSDTAIFEKVDFGVQLISFANPKRWGPPEPVFDWSGDITLKPANVEPQDWPPTAVTSS
ncbi:pentapeptide repeat-containing protein [Nocardia nova]|uniref:pentapeptide repeat-containing protein n=1 Tax=Nocardia nova TaxID=37330 RepID=UPI003710CA50